MFHETYQKYNFKIHWRMKQKIYIKKKKNENDAKY